MERRTEFVIDDIKGFKAEFKKANPELTNYKINKLMQGLTETKLIYILDENNKQSVHYELLDGITKEKLNFNEMNGYVKGCILNTCYDYFENRIEKLSNAVIKINELKTSNYNK